MYFVLENFAGGVDVRNHTLASVPGTLRSLTNAHVTPGGEIEKRKAFVRQFWDQDLSVGKLPLSRTFGLAELNNEIWVFQDKEDDLGEATWSTGDNWVDTPYGRVTLRRQFLNGSDAANSVPGAAPVDTLVDWDIFEGKLYVVAKDSAGNGTIQHFYDGQRVTSLNAAGNPLLCTRVRTFKDKIYGVQGDGIYFCAVGNPLDWATVGGTSFAGFISTSGATSEGENLTGLEIYYDALAVFSETGVQIWDMDEDDANNSLRQVIRSAGLIGAATPRQYGSGDVIFLSSSGIRSLQARDSSNAGAVSDVGSPIDFEIHKLLRENYTARADVARSMLEENTGRLWMAFGDQIWVLSQFPGPNISAWSRYTPERLSGPFFVDELVQARGMVFVRGTDDVIYLYGGADDNTYDETEAVISTPHMTLEDPAAVKHLRGLDLVCSGSWEIDFNENPVNTDWTPVARVYNSTYGYGRIGLQAITNAVALRFRTSQNTRNILSQAMIHYDLARAD